jgi:hypothetical protein
LNLFKIISFKSEPLIVEHVKFSTFEERRAMALKYNTHDFRGVTLRIDTMDLPIASNLKADLSWKLNFKHGRRVAALIGPDTLWYSFLFRNLIGF